MTSTEFRQFRNDLRTSQESIARILGVDRRTIIRWESGESPIPQAIALATDNILRHRAEMAGNHYPLMSDVLAVMRAEGLSQDEAARAFGVEP